MKELYVLWHERFVKFPKSTKYSIGLKIDSLFTDAIESISIAAFASKAEKQPYLKDAVAKVDTIKVFLQISWEMKCIDTRHYAELSEKAATVGKMLGGWLGQTMR